MYVRMAVALVALSLALPTFAKEGIRKVRGPVPGEYVVVFEDGIRDVPGAATELVQRHGGRKHRVYEHALKGFSVTLPEEAALRMSRDPRVRFVEEVPVVHPYTTQMDATWGLDRVDQRALPLDGLYVYDATGSNVTAYIIDTGIRITHPEFEGRAYVGYDAWNPSANDPHYALWDCSGHGTHVAGIVGSASYGIAKNVTLVSIRVLPPVHCPWLEASSTAVLDGIDWMVGDHTSGPAVANMSFGSSPWSALDLAVENAIADGITCVVASGNDGADACNYSPARVAGAITVNASGETDSAAGFSNWGTCTDIYAPGVLITSTFTAPAVPHWERTMSGTSMAAPHVSGAAALYLAQNTTATPADVWEAIRDAATTDALSGLDPTTPNRLLFIPNASHTADAGSVPSSVLAIMGSCLAILIARSTVA
jgi:subtilisin family serine protease